ncbi:hypothetical protein Mapa_010936 [Marchantia paleacea]|nr:hypothetical protein Mapa_010936 [Marchantia paleacea]
MRSWNSVKHFIAPFHFSDIFNFFLLHSPLSIPLRCNYDLFRYLHNPNIVLSTSTLSSILTCLPIPLTPFTFDLILRYFQKTFSISSYLFSPFKHYISSASYSCSPRQISYHSFLGLTKYPYTLLTRVSSDTIS